MWISRVRVNGGFLAGLDVKLERGLNVIIGPRGSGKTTLLELIRHALGVSNADDGRHARQESAITQLLGSGEVILELEDPNSSFHIVVDASGAGRTSRTEGLALALGQNELEAIASTASSRLNLVDMRAAVHANPPPLNDVAALTQRIFSLGDEIEQLEETAATETLLRRERKEAKSREADILASSGEMLALRREELQAIEAELLDVTGQIESTEVVKESAGLTKASLNDVSEAIERLETISAGASSLRIRSLASELLPHIWSSRGKLEIGVEKFLGETRSIQEDLEERKAALRIKAEPIRAELEDAETGLGQLTAHLRDIDAQLAQFGRTGLKVKAASAQRQQLIQQRDALLDDFEGWQESVFEARKEVAQQVSDNLAGRVVVEVEHMADYHAFRKLLEKLLANSGIQFRSAAETIAERVLPRQLVRIIEENDVPELVALTKLSHERAARVVGHLSEGGACGEIATAYLEDRVNFLLSEGDGHKNVETLSAGQKCAVTLPIVLTEPSRILLLDQPEDHLDNAYLVDHVVRALIDRRASAQTIVATHNANIPVLGGAKQVIELRSNGESGHVATLGAFDSNPVVKAITQLMEGGKDAFERRAEFYAEHGAIGG